MFRVVARNQPSERTHSDCCGCRHVQASPLPSHCNDWKYLRVCVCACTFLCSLLFIRNWRALIGTCCFLFVVGSAVASCSAHSQSVCRYCPGGPDSDFEYSTQAYTGYEPTSNIHTHTDAQTHTHTRCGADLQISKGHAVRAPWGSR